ncbi:hypothetical protein KIW84_061151 [Lathyrus oleraceus]|uniref:Uncharacterized protein n=1 Tax=Pisum sativum TaxID=3888 RepID=A0A9D4W472_PEA|nr:hypothetical protein KIW84_061151 [Pisum sativum]
MLRVQSSSDMIPFHPCSVLDLLLQGCLLLEDMNSRTCVSKDVGAYVISLQALGYVLIARPEFMLEHDIGKILEETLSSHADARLKIQALQNMFEYLLDAESKMEAEVDDNVPGHSVRAGQSVPVAAGAGDTNICGGIVQLIIQCEPPRDVEACIHRSRRTGRAGNTGVADDDMVMAAAGPRLQDACQGSQQVCFGLSVY